MVDSAEEKDSSNQGTQRRHLTVLFADLSRSTEIIDAVDAEDPCASLSGAPVR